MPNSVTSSSPGPMPARNSRPKDFSAATANRIMVIEGGNKMPSVPPAAMIPAAKAAEIAALAHLGDAGGADRRAGRGRGARHCRKQCAGEHVGDAKSAG